MMSSMSIDRWRWGMREGGEHRQWKGSERPLEREGEIGKARVDVGGPGHSIAFTSGRRR